MNEHHKSKPPIKSPLVAWLVVLIAVSAVFTIASFFQP
jgi:hypothetical protein